jgi:heme/copper-type cytochrome/quinol oxidase subunit 2
MIVIVGHHLDEKEQTIEQAIFTVVVFVITELVVALFVAAAWIWLPRTPGYASEYASKVEHNTFLRLSLIIGISVAVTLLVVTQITP